MDHPDLENNARGEKKVPGEGADAVLGWMDGCCYTRGRESWWTTKRGEGVLEGWNLHFERGKGREGEGGVPQAVDTEVRVMGYAD